VISDGVRTFVPNCTAARIGNATENFDFNYKNNLNNISFLQFN